MSAAKMKENNVECGIKRSNSDSQSDISVSKKIRLSTDKSVITLSPKHSVDTTEQEICNICWMPLKGKKLASPENCNHIFCMDCLKTWCQEQCSCPLDRKLFNKMVIRDRIGGEVIDTVTAIPFDHIYTKLKNTIAELKTSLNANNANNNNIMEINEATHSVNFAFRGIGRIFKACEVIRDSNESDQFVFQILSAITETMKDMIDSVNTFNNLVRADFFDENDVEILALCTSFAIDSIDDIMQNILDNPTYAKCGII